MMKLQGIILFYFLLVFLVQGYVIPAQCQVAKLVKVQSKLPLMACRRNNKEEKRKRNKEYARKYQSKTGESRKKVVVEFKRGIVAANEAKFQAELFKLTTDDDMPAYSGFDFIA